MAGLVFLLSCGEKNKTVIKVISQQADTTFGMAVYNVYCSDTSWEDMKIFGDSLCKLHDGKLLNVIHYYYPEHTVPVFKEDDLFSDKAVSTEPYFVTAVYYDTSHVNKPVFKKKPENYKEAKEYEKNHP